MYPEEREAWRALFDGADAYPVDKFMPPLKRAGRKATPRLLAGIVWQLDDELAPEPKVIGIEWSAGGHGGTLDLARNPASAATQLGKLLERPELRSRLIASWGASQRAFSAFLRTLALPLVADGYTIEPIATGTECKALIIRKGRRVWWLCDAQHMTGGLQLTETQFVAEYAPRTRAAPGSPEALADALGGFQRQLLGAFGVAIGATIGAAALRAARQHIPAKEYVWRPPPLLVSMLRSGHGMRGGYVYAEAFNGLAYSWDVTKAYTAALAHPLPRRCALVAAPPAGEDSDGIYLCRVTGRGTLPAYLARWDGETRTFTLDAWQGGTCWAVLASSEFIGLQSLGYSIEPRGGYAFVRTWSLAPFVERVAAISKKHGRGSAHERTAKVIGNAVYGKFAENPLREEVIYAGARPGDDWHPMVTLAGDEVPYLWVRQTVTHRPGQHIEIAATVTGRVRSQVQSAAALALALGGRVVHVDTDGLLATVNGSEWLDTTPDAVGAWRVDDEPQHALVWGRKGYAYGDEIRAAGMTGLTMQDAEALSAGATVSRAVTVRPAPWLGRAAPETTWRRAFSAIAAGTRSPRSTRGTARTPAERRAG